MVMTVLDMAKLKGSTPFVSWPEIVTVAPALAVANSVKKDFPTDCCIVAKPQSRPSLER